MPGLTPLGNDSPKTLIIRLKWENNFPEWVFTRSAVPMTHLLVAHRGSIFMIAGTPPEAPFTVFQPGYSLMDPVMRLLV